MENVQLSLSRSAATPTNSQLNMPHAVAACPFSLARALTGGLSQPPQKLFFLLKQMRMRDCALLHA